MANTSSAISRANQQTRINRLRFQKRMGTLATFAVAVGGPLLALGTFLALGPLNQNSGSRLLRFVLLADLVYVLAVAALVLHRVVSLLSARRSHSVGSKLRLRLTRFFAALALIPTITVAVFAVITVNFGLEGWFSDRVQNVLSSSFSAAEAYEEEHRRDLDSDANSLARFINATRENTPFMTDGTTRRVLVQGQSQIVRGLKEAYVIDGDGQIRARGDRSYLFDYEQPNAIQIQLAHDEGILIIDDWDNNEFR
ncbi:MAG: PAS domain-containing sensor histidine kinase, partial [Paracoccaceae bacterium]|nr:PAS domain-containing sensor histidine kinase [Paracoccaceae bacterium]